MNESNLLACPFCGSDNVEVVNWIDNEKPHRWFVICRQCGVHGPPASCTVEATSKWNTRINM
jgi:Lar family restriction alleviation protein